MRFAAILLALALVPAGAQLSKPAAAPPATPSPAVTPTEKPRIPRQTFTDLERLFDNKLATIGNTNDPLDLLGATRGLYLDGYGAVFTTELSLIITPTINPFRQQITKEEAVKVHQRKLDRLPLLRKTMRDMVQASASVLGAMPANQQLVVAVRLLYLPWEDTTGLPGQIVMKAERRAALTDDIKTEEQ